MADKGVGVFVVTPDRRVGKFTVDDHAVDAIQYFEDGLPKDFEFMKRPFGVHFDGRFKDIRGEVLLPEGYFKIFVPAIARLRFQRSLRGYFPVTNDGRAYPPPAKTGFLGAFWRKSYSAAELLQAARHACQGRCNPPAACKEQFCKCNHALGRCL